MANEERIDDIFDFPKIKSEFTQIEDLISRLRADLKNVGKANISLSGADKISDIVTGVNASNDALVKFRGSANEATTAVRALKAEQVELRNEGARLSNALKQQAIDARAKAAAEKEAALAAKAAAKEAQEAGSERLRQLKAEQADAEKLAQIERDRAAAEAQQFEASRGAAISTGGSNRKVVQGGGSFTPSTELERQVNFLQKNQTALAANSVAQKQLAKDLAAGTITQAQYDEKITQAIILQNEYRESIALNTAEIKKLQNVNEEELRIEEEELSVRKELADAETRVSNFADRQFQAATASEQAALSLTKNKEALAGVQNQRKIYDNALKEGNITQAQHARLINETVIKEQQYKAAISQSSAELKKAVELEKLDGTALRAKQLKLAELIREYGLLNAAQRNSVDGKAKLSQITILNKDVLELEKSTGRAQRNVGNYTSAIGKAFSGLKTIANILPGIGIAGLFGLALDPLFNFIGGLIEANKNLDKTKTITAEAGSAFAKATASVSELNNNVQLAKQGFIDKDKVVEQYNETVGKTAGQLKTLDEVEKALAKNADNYIKVTFYKAAANLALEEAAKKAFEAEQTRRKKEEEFASRLTEGATNFANQGVLFDVKNIQKAEEQKRKAREEAKQKEIDRATKEQNQFEQIAKKFQKGAAELSNKSGFNFFNDSDEDAKKAEAAAEKARKKAEAEGKKIEADRKRAAELSEAQRKADLDRLKKSFEEQKTTAKDLFENDLLLDKQRIQARKIQSEKEIAIVKTQYEIDLSNKNITNKQKLLLDEQLAIDVQKIIDKESIDLLVMRSKQAAERRKQDKQIADDYEKLQEEQAKAEKVRIDKLTSDTKELNEARILQVTNARDKELNLLDDKRKNGTISEIKFNRERININERANEDLLYAQLEFAEKNLNILKASGKDITKQEEELSKIRIKIAKDYGEKAKEENEKAANVADLNAGLQKFKGYYDQIDSVVSSALDASYNKQKNQIQDLIDKNEERKNKEIEGIERSTLSEQDKAAKLIQINARAAAERERLELKQRQLDQKRATFEKASKIAQIALNGALAVTAQLAIPGNIAGAIAAGVLAAAQLAIAIATPIPKFRHGTKNAPEGLAIVGDGFKHEVHESNGQFALTPAVPTLTYLKAGDKVHPDADVFMKEWSAKVGRRVSLGAGSAVEKDDRLLNQMKVLTNVVKSKPVPVIQNNMNGIKTFWNDSAGRQRTWVNQNMQS